MTKDSWIPQSLKQTLTALLLHHNSSLGYLDIQESPCWPDIWLFTHNGTGNSDRELAQWVKYVPCKRVHLSSDSSHLHKKLGIPGHSVDLELRLRGDDRMFPRYQWLADPANLMESPSFSEIQNIKNIKENNLISIPSFHKHVCVNIWTYSQTYNRYRDI